MELNSEKEIIASNNEKISALFLCNEKFLNSLSTEGGVKFCTDEYIKLIQLNFDLTLIPVSYSTRWSFRLKLKLGLSAYDAYQPEEYNLLLRKNLDNTDINIVFLNLTNTIQFAEFIKKKWPHVKVILCSHGNESGDHLHSIALHKNYKGILRNSATYSLGNMLLKESHFRKYIDLVLTVSDVEVGIEKWLGTENILMVPRFIAINNIERKPVNGRVGFLADLTHEPNFYGIKEVCEALKKLGAGHTTLHLVGAGKERGLILARLYPFVKYVGYLNEVELNDELKTWTFALNPVFYYSRGVSTKLGKALGMGLPVITTEKGMRGYEWTNGMLPVCNTADEMAELINKLSINIEAIQNYNMEVIKIQSTSTSLNETAKKLVQFLKVS